MAIDMKKAQFGESKAHRFFTGKGFYLALALSLAAVGGAAWLGVNSALNNLEQTVPPQENTVSRLEQNNEWSVPSEYDHPVTAPQQNIPAASSSPASSQPEPEPSQPPISQGCILPLSGEVINEYSGDKVVKSKTLDDWIMHTGVDLAAEAGTPVKAMSAGTVAAIANDDMWGTTVTINHGDGLESYYANLKSAVNVRMGQTVSMGTVIGAVGESAEIEQAEGPHLHFGVKQDGEWIDPLSMAK